MFGTVDHGTHMRTSLEVMDLNFPAGVDPHVETSREELELALKEVEDLFHKLDAPTAMGTGDSKGLGAGPNGSICASSTTASDLQQAEVVLAANTPGSHPDKMPWPQISVYNASQKGTDAKDDLLATIKLTSDEAHRRETGSFRQPGNAVPTPFTVLPLERVKEFSKYKQKAVRDSSPKVSGHENDGPICKRTQDEKYREKVMATATEPENGSQDTVLQKKIPEASSGECPKAVPKPSSVHQDHSVGKERAHSGPTERRQVESQGPNSGPTTFSGLFNSMVSSDNLSSQLVEVANPSNGPLATSSGISAASSLAVRDFANTTTRLMLDSLNQPHRRLEPPGNLRVGNAIDTRHRMKPNASVPALGGQPDSYREARVASAAHNASAAASAAKNAVQAAEASIEALANLGINNGSLHQARNSFINPRPLQVASESEPMAAGVKRPFQGQRPPSAEQNGGKSTTGKLDLIKIGSIVEVMSEEDGLQGGWFIAKVLSMAPKNALVVYDDLMTDDGRSHLEESFPLHCSREEDTFGTTVPGACGWIRPVHPFSSTQKRGYISMVHENWVVGDYVDVFVDDGWWEGIIEDLDEADETRITVFFPGDRSTTVVRTWNVRPSLVWKKGEWRPCRGDSVVQDGPPSKRRKTDTARGKVEREQAKAKVTPARNPVQERKMTPEPLPIASTRRSTRSESKGMVLYSSNTDTGQGLGPPGREPRSATRPTTQTRVPVKTTASKKPTPAPKDTRNGGSPLTRSQQMELAATPEPPWDVRRLSTRSQQKESAQDAGRGHTPSTRSAKKEVVVLPQDTVRGKTPSRLPQPKETIEASRNSKALAIIPLPREAEPQTRARTRAQLAAKKG